MIRTRRTRLVGLVALYPLLAARASVQADRPTGREPFTIVLGAEDPVLEGRGPKRVFEHAMLERGELFVWVSSDELDPMLRVEIAGRAEVLEQEDGGGGTAAFLRQTLDAGERVRITVAASEPAQSGTCLVQIVEAPAIDAEQLAVLEAAEHVVDAAGEGWRARRFGEARERLAAALDAVLALPGLGRHVEIEQVCVRIGDIADDEVDLQTAVRAWRAALAFRETHYPPDSQPISSVRLNVGLVLRGLGAPDEAIEQHERVLATRRRTLDEGDANLLRAMRYLANTYHVAGRYEDALALAQKAVEVTRRTRPPDDPELIDALRMLTLPLKALERWPEVLELERRIERSTTERLPPDDPSLLQARENLANTLTQMGDLEEARDLLEGVLAARLAALPEDATLVQWARQDLAAVFYKLGERERSLELLEAAYTTLAGKYPPEHPEVLRARENLIVQYAGSGREREALELQRETYERLAARLPPGHPDLLRSKANLARSEGDVSNVAEAVRLIDEVLAAREATFEPDHPLHAATLQSAATLHVAAGDAGTALDLMERSWAILERTLPPGDAKRLNARENLAMIRQAYGDVRGALAELEPVYAQRSRELSPGNHNLLVVQGNMATLLRGVGEHDRALELARAALEGASERPEGDSLRQALELLLVGLLRVEGRTEEALALVENALQRARESYDDDHPTVQKIRAALAEVLLDAGRPADARESVEAALAKVAATHPPSHTDRIGLQTLAGQIDVALNEPAAARSAFLEAARALRAHLDEVAATFGPRAHEEVNQLSREVLDGLLSARDPALPAAEQDTESLRFLLAFRGHAERRGRARALVRELAARDEEIARLDAAARSARMLWLEAREGVHASAELLALRPRAAGGSRGRPAASRGPKPGRGARSASAG